MSRGVPCSFGWRPGAELGVHQVRTHVVEMEGRGSQRWEFEARWTWRLSEHDDLLSLDVVEPTWRRLRIGNARDVERRDALDPMLMVPPPCLIRPDGGLHQCREDPPDRFPDLPDHIQGAARRTWLAARDPRARAGRLADTWRTLVQEWAHVGALPPVRGESRRVKAPGAGGGQALSELELRSVPMDLEGVWWEVATVSRPDQDAAASRIERTLQPGALMPLILASDTETRTHLITRRADLRPRELTVERRVSQEVLPPGASASVRGTSRDHYAWTFHAAAWPDEQTQGAPIIS